MLGKSAGKKCQPPGNSAPAIENEPVRSDAPALVLAGEFDPDTPPDWGRQILESMPRAYYVELRAQEAGTTAGTTALLAAAAPVQPGSEGLLFRGGQGRKGLVSRT